MTKTRKTTGVFKRLLNLGAEGGKAPLDPVKTMTRAQLEDVVRQMQEQNLALHGALTLQHEVANNALRLLGNLYQFMFGIVYAYVTALRNFKEAGNTKPIPAIWIASRVCETLESLFQSFPDMQRLDIGPNKDLIRNMFEIAMMKVNPGSNLGVYLNNAPPPAEKNVDDIKDADIPQAPENIEATTALSEAGEEIEKVFEGRKSQIEEDIKKGAE